MIREVLLVVVLGLVLFAFAKGGVGLAVVVMASVLLGFVVQYAVEWEL